MLDLAAPAYYGFLVAPRGNRPDPALAPLALESLIVDESVDRLQVRFKMLGKTEILGLFARRGMHFEDHNKHVISLSLLGELKGTGATSPPSRNVTVSPHKCWPHRLQVHQTCFPPNLDVTLYG